jgi:hypothetical protein
MGERNAISALTLLVAVCEQVLLELETLEHPLTGAVEAVTSSRDQAVSLVRALQTREQDRPAA